MEEGEEGSKSFFFSIYLFISFLIFLSVQTQKNNNRRQCDGDQSKREGDIEEGKRGEEGDLTAAARSWSESAVGSLAQSPWRE